MPELVHLGPESAVARKLLAMLATRTRITHHTHLTNALRQSRQEDGLPTISNQTSNFYLHMWASYRL
jgi:hypothetical protein